MDTLIAPSAVTLEDIARHCGVGRSTASRALIGDPHVRPETRARIQEAAAALGYNPARHEAARRMALRKTGRRVTNYVIAFLVPLAFEKDAYFARMFQGLMEVLAEEGFALVVAYPRDLTEHLRPLPPIFFRGEIDGIITVADLVNTPPVLAQLRQDEGFGASPVVSMINPMPGCSSVCNDDEDGAYQAAGHLLAHGHRHLLQFTYPSFGTLEQRLAGVRRALRDYGLAPEQHLHLFDLHEHSATRNWYYIATPAQKEPASAVRPARKAREPLGVYLRAHPEITGILALNDLSAIQAWYALGRAGYRVPEEISIIGFDDVEAVPDMQGNNLLTTVRLPLGQVGRTAARLMIRLVTDPTGDEDHVILPTELVIRQSTAARG